MNRLLTISIILVTAISVFAFPVRITTWQVRDDVKRLNALNVSVDNVNPLTQSIIAYVRNDIEFNLLLSNGFLVEKMPDSAREYADKLLLDPSETDDPLRAYLTFTEYTAFMVNIANQYPNICQLVQFGTSVQNRPLYFLKISDNVLQQENEPEVRLVSSIHGNEVVGYDILIRLILLLTSEYGSDLRITNIVNNTELLICPMLNPDGYVSATRYNANGVDLNRNFPSPSGNQHPDGLTWQQETLAFINHALENSITLSANYHGGALVVNYPWDYTYALAPDNDLLIQASLTYSNHNSPMYNSPVFPQGITNGAEWYVIQGGLQDWSYGFTGGMDLTIEVSNDYWPNSSTLDTYWAQNQESVLSLIEFAQKGVHGLVTNSAGSPLPASITINSPGIDIKTDPQVGDYHRMLLPGTYTLTAYSPGYTLQSSEVVVPPNTAVTNNFVLEPLVYTDFTATITNHAGMPLSNASGTLKHGYEVFDFQTNAQGSFSLQNIPADKLTAQITAPGYGVCKSSFTNSEENNRHIFVLPAPLFYDDFENGLGNWTVQSPWAIVTDNVNRVLTDSPTGNYSNNRNINAVMSTPVSLNNIINPMLSFNIRHYLESNYDFLYVQASSSGVSWNTLALFTGESSTWQTISLPLDDYVGGNLHLRFKLTSDNSITADGVYLDNVCITGLATNQTVYGDIDANWIINLDDAQHIMQYSVGNNPIPQIDSPPWEAFRFEAADVDNDDQITATDAFYIYKRINLYDSAFPAQGGNAFAFVNPGISVVVHEENLLNIIAQNPANLRALSLEFSSAGNLAVQSVNWNPNLQNVITAVGTDNRKIAFLAFNNSVSGNPIVGLTVSTPDEYVTCAGQVNDAGFMADINLTSNNDITMPPLVTALLGNYPNPFNPQTRISFSLSQDNTPVVLSVYNLKGQLVTTLIDINMNKGVHNVTFDGKDINDNPLSSGIYYYKLIIPAKSFTGKMVLMK